MKAGPRTQLQLLAQNALFAVLLVAAALLAVYLLRDVTLQWDITQNKRGSLSQATREVLAKMQGPVTITAYAPAANEVRALIHDFVAPYQRAKPDLELKFIDPREQPKQAAAANVRSHEELVVQYAGRSEHLTSLSEQDMANLLTRLLRNRERVVMSLDGHGEPSLTGQRNFDLGEFGQQLQSKGFRVQGLNLAVAQAVPDNCSVLVIGQPRTTLLKGEVDKLERYLERGGNLLWLVDEGPLRGLEPLAEKLGIRLPPGVVIDLAGQELAGNATVAVGIAESFHPMLAGDSTIAVFPLARPIDVEREANKGWRATPVIVAAKRGWVETSDIAKGVEFDKGADVNGPVDLVVALERDIEGKPQRVVVAGASSFLSSQFLGNAGNLDLGVNMMNWLSADENLVAIQPRARVDSTLALSRTGLFLIAAGFLLVLPAVLLGAGGAIWWRRRRG
jgi:ABC-type uncharacterized transport system involved in gliding motility auxiliary subunit